MARFGTHSSQVALVDLASLAGAAARSAASGGDGVRRKRPALRPEPRADGNHSAIQSLQRQRAARQSHPTIARQNLGHDRSCHEKETRSAPRSRPTVCHVSTALRAACELMPACPREPWACTKRSAFCLTRKPAFMSSQLTPIRFAFSQPADQRDHRLRAGHAGCLSAHAPGGPVECLRAAAGRNGHRQGADRQGHPPAQQSRQAGRSSASIAAR